jgi:TolB-like protein
VPVAAELRPTPSEIIKPFTGASVAVLPLDNLSNDPRNNHLCDGITGDIITNLSRFRDLLVIARHSAFFFRNHDVPSSQIAGPLGVRYLMTGGLQRSGRKIRLRVQLTEADTDRVIWSDRYDGTLGDLFAFQDDVTATIAARLAVQISAAEHRRLLAENPPDLRAYGLILRGQDLGLRFRKEANLHARRLFEHAAELDPDYGRCYAGMSRTFNLAWRYHWTPKPELALDKAVDLANAAISYDNLDARGYGELGFASLYKKQHDSSLAAYERAVQLNPNDADILAEMGDSLVYSGHAQRAVQLLKRAMRLNPFHPDWYLWYLGDAYFHLNDYEETVQTLLKMRDQSEAHRLLASSYAHLGRMKEARRHAKQLLQIHPNFSLAHWRNVPPNKNPEELDVFIEGLRKAGLK